MLTYPTKSYLQMYDLIGRSRVQPLQNLFTDFLVMAICWEETMFNNIKQNGTGTAVGFGQTEPGELYKLDGGEDLKKPGIDIDKKNPHFAQAKRYNYFLPPLPTRDGRKLAGGALSDEQSIAAISSMLCHNYYSNGQSRDSALKAYAGVFTSRAVAADLAKGKIDKAKADKLDPLKEPKRLQIIQGWENCEKELKKIEDADLFNDYVDRRPKIMAALAKAKPYPTKDFEYQFRLFPEGNAVWNPKAPQLDPMAPTGDGPRPCLQVMDNRLRRP